MRSNPLTTELLGQLRKAFDTLPPGEQRDIAPAVIAKLFHDEAPIHGGWKFEEGFGLHERLNRIADGLPVPDDTKKKSKKAGAEPEKSAEEMQAEAEAVAAPPPPVAVPTSQISLKDSSTIASLDGTIAAFEAALRPALAKKKKTPAVLPVDIKDALAIASSAERTPVEIVALGVRARRFVDELNAGKVYGYAARQQLLALAKHAENLPPELQDQIGRIDAYRAAIDSVSPRAVTTEGIHRILHSIDALLACDQRMGAQRACDRYFENGVPRHKVDYNEGQRFLMGLRKYIKA